MRKAFFLFLSLFLMYGSLNGQDPKILKGVSELRKVVFEHYELNLKQVELIRQKLDSVGVTKKEFTYFASQLNYVSKHLHSEELEGREYLISFLLENKAYKKLTEVQRAIILENFDLICFTLPGVWDERYPHRINPNSIRLKEISNYNIKEGEDILHYQAFNNHLCDILLLSFDSINIAHYPLKFNWTDKSLFNMIDTCCSTDTRNINYPLSKSSKLDDSKYDKIIYDAFGINDLRRTLSYKHRFKEIYQLLEDEGELIVSANAVQFGFDGPFDVEKYLDSVVEKILKYRFELKERIFSENEYVVYKFSKVLD